MVIALPHVSDIFRQVTWHLSERPAHDERYQFLSDKETKRQDKHNTFGSIENFNKILIESSNCILIQC